MAEFVHYPPGFSSSVPVQALQAVASGSGGNLQVEGAIAPFIQAVALPTSSQTPAHWLTLHLASLQAISADLCAGLPSSLHQQLMLVSLQSGRLSQRWSGTCTSGPCTSKLTAYKPYLASSVQDLGLSILVKSNVRSISAANDQPGQGYCEHVLAESFVHVQIQTNVFRLCEQACLKAYGSDQLPECKAAARQALEAIPISAKQLVAVLESPWQPPGRFGF